MPLPSPLIGDPGKLTTAFRALETVLKEDDVLQVAVKMWRTWVGDPDDGMDLAQPQKPVVRLTPSHVALVLGEVDHYDGLFPIRVEIAMEGTDFDHAGDMMTSFLAALRGDRPFRDTTVRKFLQMHGCDIQYLNLGFEWKPLPPDQLILSTVTMRLFIPA